MMHNPSISPYAVDTERFRHSGDVTPLIAVNPTLSKGKWWTPWHEFIDANGVLAESGKIRVVLRDDQWMIEKHGVRWKPFSFHRDCQSIKRVLREKCLIRGNEHLVPDFKEVLGILEAL